VATDDFKPGQLRGGFNQLARDLDRAIAISMFSSLQNFIIEQARELSYTEARVKGLMEPLPFKLNITDLAKLAGCGRTSLSEAFSSLVRARVFFTYKDNLYLISKDYRLWLSSDGQPRLTDRQVAWCREAARNLDESADAVESEVAPMSENPDTELSTLSEKPDTVSENSDTEQNSTVGKTRHKCRKIPTLVPPPNPPHTPPIDEPPLRERRDNTHTLLADTQPFTLPSSPQRTPEDSALVHEAAALLGADLRTAHLQGELLRNENLPDCRAVAGWKWKLAVETLLGPSINSERKRRNFQYLYGIASKYTEDDRHSTPALNGTLHPARKPTFQEREREYVEKMRRAAERIKNLEDEL
jgi:hypothetical protein